MHLHFLLRALKQSVGNEGIWISQLLGLYLGDASGFTMLAFISCSSPWRTEKLTGETSWTLLCEIPLMGLVK